MRAFLQRKNRVHQQAFSSLPRPTLTVFAPNPKDSLLMSPPAPQRQFLQAPDRATDDLSGSTAPPIVNSVLHSSGQPLDASSRAVFEPRFGHDFSRVRVHSDEQAAESARSVNALAYTVGDHIVFGVGQHRPGTEPGNRLLAHELTHVVQQSGRPAAPRLAIGRSHDLYEQAADKAAVSCGDSARTSTNQPPQQMVQRVSLGKDGPLTSARSAIVLKGAGIAEQLVMGLGTGDKFSRNWDAFWKGKGAKITPQPTLAQYQKALKDRVVNDMDTSKNKDVKAVIEGEKELPLERQTAAVTPVSSTKTYMREFAIDQGADSVAHLLIHESLHGAGVPMGFLDMFEPFMHQFEAGVGFPMSVGGADISKVEQTRSGDYAVSVKISYSLYAFTDEDLPENIVIEIVYPNSGEVVTEEQADGSRKPAQHKIDSRAGSGEWEWKAHSPGWRDYVIRIRDTDNDVLLESRDITTDPRCILGVSSIHCDDSK